MKQLRKLTYSEALEAIKNLELDSVLWVCFAGNCIEAGIDYKGMALLNAMYDVTGESYDMHDGLLDGSDWSNIFNDIETLLSKEPTADEIYRKCADVQKKYDYGFADEAFAIVFCYEFGIEFNKDEFTKVLTEICGAID